MIYGEPWFIICVTIHIQVELVLEFEELHPRHFRSMLKTGYECYPKNTLRLCKYEYHPKALGQIFRKMTCQPSKDHGRLGSDHHAEPLVKYFTVSINVLKMYIHTGISLCMETALNVQINFCVLDESYRLMIKRANMVVCQVNIWS